MKISVIVPVYNADKFLHYCVESVINQTYKDIELILVDDGSTDNSSELCDQYARKYDFIKVFHKENGGQCSARNVGIKNATGDYISFVDNDDLIHPQYYEIMVKIIKESHCEICTCLRSRINSVEDINNKKIEKKHFKIINTKDIIYNELVKCGEYVFTSAFHTKLVKSELFNKFIFNEELRDEEDTLLISQFYNNIEKIAFIDEVLYFNIQNKNSITRTDKNKWKNIYYLIKCRKYMLDLFGDYKYKNVLISNFIMKILREIGLVYEGENIEFNEIRDYFISEFKPFKNDIDNFFVKKLFDNFANRKFSFLKRMKFIFSIYKRYRNKF